MIKVSLFIWIGNKFKNKFDAFIATIKIILVSMCLSSPYLIFCDITNLSLNSINNESFEIYEDCVATSDKTIIWNYISGWYPTIVSYILPVFVISFCYIRIMIYLSSNKKNFHRDSVRFSEISVYSLFH